MHLGLQDWRSLHQCKAVTFRNADALSHRPVYDEESEEEVGLRVAATNRKEASCDLSETRQKTLVSTEKGMTMTELQAEDPDIAPILRLRLQQTEQPQPEEVLPESEAVKVLWGQWHNLRLKDGVLYRERNGLRGRPAIIQLVVPQAKKLEFIKCCHEGMTGGHRAFRSTLEQVRRRGFWFGLAKRCSEILSSMSKLRELSSWASSSIWKTAANENW